MVELLVALLTLTPAALGAIHGFRVGGQRLIARWGTVALSWAVGVAAVCLSFRVGLFVPFGLLTPVVAGILFATATAVILHRAARARSKREVPRTGRATRLAGALVGLVGGLAIASSSRLGLVAIDGVSYVDPTRSRQVARGGAGASLHALVRTANQGFLRHLPMVGSASDEIESLIFVLNADPAIQERLAEEKGWKQLTVLPSFRAIIEDSEVLDEIESVSEGSIAALYRLQRNPKVIAFLVDDRVQAILPGVRPTALARQIEQIESERRTRRLTSGGAAGRRRDP